MKIDLPPVAWEVLLEILRSHDEEHGDFDITTIISLYNEISRQVSDVD